MLFIQILTGFFERSMYLCRVRNCTLNMIFQGKYREIPMTHFFVREYKGEKAFSI